MFFQCRSVSKMYCSDKTGDRGKVHPNNYDVDDGVD